ncbi:MAG: polysaccharide deacetylase [Elusimicrobia bacterium]|nr:MAG: polysaccharide deacetylase [Elusimicrobiota bacterium]KAF0154483.1 MAG: polysaccharide deacetylase [Elusimicrobiota bacterium]
MGMKTTVLLAALISLNSLPAAAGGFEDSLSTENLLSMEVPAAAEAAPARDAASDYARYYSALRHYSDIAFRSEPGTEAYAEAYIAANYLNGRLESLRGTGAAKSARIDLDFLGPDRATLAEIDAFFGWGNVMKGEQLSPPVTIKAGFATIKYVKGNTPFLVQGDSFLKKGEIILTFDDGPDTHGLTAAVLETNEGVAPSIFFVLGSKLGPAGREVIKAQARKGHEVSLHGYWHATETGKPFTAYSTSQAMADLQKTAGLIKNATGKDPAFFRPPYGIISPAALRDAIDELGVTPMGWTIDTLDWSTRNPDELFEKTVSLISKRGKGIVLMHDIHPQSVQVNVRLIQWLKDNGYKVVNPETATRAFRGN